MSTAHDDSLLPRAGRQGGKVLKFPSELATSQTVDWSLRPLISPKLDGNRCLIINGVAYTSAMRVYSNPHVASLLTPLLEMSLREQLFWDLEIYDPSGSHHAALSGALNSYTDPLPSTTSMYVFDGGPTAAFSEQCVSLPFYERALFVANRLPTGLSNLICVPQHEVSSWSEVECYNENFLSLGYEGSIVRAGDIERDGRSFVGGWYKHGRATVNQRIGHKLKQYLTFEGIIIDVVQGTKLDTEAMARDGVERERSADGSLSRNGLQRYQALDEIAGAFLVEWIGLDGKKQTTEIGFARGFDHQHRRSIWSGRQRLIGSWCEFKAMPHGAKSDGGARHGKYVRPRPDLHGQTLEEKQG